MDHTGSITYIGIVFRNDGGAFRRIMSAVLSAIGNVHLEKIQFSFDSEEWRVSERLDEAVMTDLYRSEMFDIEVEITVNHGSVPAFITKEVLEKEQAIMLGFYDHHMFQAFAGDRDLSLDTVYENALKRYTDYCIELAKNICLQEKDILYAFCDNDAMLKYGFEEILGGKSQEYSLVFLPNGKGDIKILKSAWEIDGYTSRKP